MTNDEAMYAWKARRIAEAPGFVLDPEAWRRHPPAVPAAAGLLARVVPIETALSLVSKLGFAAALLAMAGLAARLGGPVAGLGAATLLALDEVVRTWAPHFLLDLPLVAVLCAAAWLWTYGGRARIAALAVALLAPLVKTYGLLVPVALLGAAAMERVGPRLRLTLVGVAALGALAALVLGQLDLVRTQFYWLAPHDLRATTGAKLYHLAVGFQWIAPGARARTLALLLVPIALFTAAFLRLPRREDRTLLAMLLLTPILPLLATRVVEPRAQLLLVVPLLAAIAVAVACAVERVRAPGRRRILAGGLLAAGVTALLATEALRVPPDPCRYVGSYEIAPWLRANVARTRDRVFAASSHQVRWYAGLEFEKDGGPLYGKNEWTGIPRERAVFLTALEERPGDTLLVLSADPDGRPAWLRLDPGMAEELRALGFEAAATAFATWLPACDASPESAAAEAGFWRVFGLERSRAGAGGREWIASGVLRRARSARASDPAPPAPPPTAIEATVR